MNTREYFDEMPLALSIKEQKKAVLLDDDVCVCVFLDME